MKKLLFVVIALAFTSSAYAFDLSTVCFRNVKSGVVWTGRVVVRGNTISLDYMGQNGNWSGMTGTFPGQIDLIADGYKVTGLTMSSSDGYTINHMNIQVVPTEVKLWQHNDRPQVNPRIPCP